jgi:hypothetical protein
MAAPGRRCAAADRPGKGPRCTMGRQQVSTGWVWHERYMWHDTGSGAGARSAGGYIEPGLHIDYAPAGHVQSE